MDERKKRVTVSFKGELLDWVDRKIEEKTFHNYQHAVDYCLMREYRREAPGLLNGVVLGDRVVVSDGEGRRVAEVYFSEGLWCSECGYGDCVHTRFASSIPEVRSYMEDGATGEEGGGS